MKNFGLLRTAGSLFALVGNCVTVSVTYSCTCAVKCKVTSPSKAISKEISKEIIQFPGSEEQLTKEENKNTLLYRAELNCGPVANTTLLYCEWFLKIRNLLVETSVKISDWQTKDRDKELNFMEAGKVL